MEEQVVVSYAMKQITVETAIKKAWRLRWITICIFSLFPLVILVYVARYDLNPLYVLGGFVTSILTGIIYNNFSLQNWRIWAFTHARNVHLLKKLALEDRFIPNGKIFDRLEYVPARYKAKWIALQEKFNIPDDSSMDDNLPEEILIKKDVLKILTTTYLLFYIILCGLPSIWFLINDYYTIGLTGILLTLVLALTEIRTIRKLFSKSIELIIGNNGITINQKEFYACNDIKNIDVVPYYPSGEQRIYALTFITKNGKQYISLNQYRVSRFEMLNLLQTFRARWSKQNI